jgi:hypothetical protein
VKLPEPTSAKWRRAAQNLEHSQHYTSDDIISQAALAACFILLGAGLYFLIASGAGAVWVILVLGLSVVGATVIHRACVTRSIKASTLRIESELAWLADHIGDWRVAVLLATPDTIKEHMFGIGTWKTIRNNFDAAIVDATMALSVDNGYFEVAQDIAGALWPYDDGRRRMDPAVSDVLVDVLTRVTSDGVVAGRLFRESVRKELSVC